MGLKKEIIKKYFSEKIKKIAPKIGKNITWFMSRPNLGAM
jgi:hypothetical protein